MNGIRNVLIILFFISVICLPVEGKAAKELKTFEFRVAEPVVETTINRSEDEERFNGIFSDYRIQIPEEYSDNDGELEDNAVVLDLRAAGNKPVGKIFRLGAEKTYTREKVSAFNTYYIDNDFIRHKELQGHYLPSSFFSKYVTGHFDENTSVSVGQKSLTYSPNGIQSGLFSDMMSDYDKGARIDTKIGKTNIWGGVYQSSQTFENSGGFGLVTDEKSFGKNSGISAGAVAYSGTKNSGGIFVKYRYKNLSLGIQPSIIVTSNISGNKYEEECYFLPEYKMSETLTLTGKFAHAQRLSGFGISYKPKITNSRDFSLNFDALFYDSNETRRQKFKVSTQFRL